MECRLALWKLLKILKIGLPYDPAIPLLGVYPNNMKSESLWYLHLHGHSSTIYNSQNMETTQVSISGSLEKEDVVYVCIVKYYSDLEREILQFSKYMSLEDITEKAMAPHSSTLPWKIPWMEEPGRLQSMGSLRVGHN